MLFELLLYPLYTKMHQMRAVLISWRLPMRLLAAILGLALAIRLGYLFSIRDDLFTKQLIIDAAFYDRWGQQIAKGDWLGVGVFSQDPLYAYFLGFCYWIFGHSPNAVRVMQALLDVVSVGLFYYLGAAIAGPRGGIAAAEIAAIYGPFVYYVGLLDKTSFSAFLNNPLAGGVDLRASS